jgi:hypothetical protein
VQLSEWAVHCSPLQPHDRLGVGDPAVSGHGEGVGKGQLSTASMSSPSAASPPPGPHRNVPAAEDRPRCLFEAGGLRPSGRGRHRCPTGTGRRRESAWVSSYPRL